jgi:hypothetical protein
LNVHGVEVEPGKLPVQSVAHVEFTPVAPNEKIIVEFAEKASPLATTVLPAGPLEGDSTSGRRGSTAVGGCRGRAGETGVA